MQRDGGIMSSDGKCINCGAMLQTGEKKRVICPYCGTNNIFEKSESKPGMIVCAQCGNESPQAHEHCSECGADLYYVCPNCSTRNTAEALHCVKCGVNIAQAIKNWQIHEAQERARREEQDKKRSKTLRAIFVPIGCLVGLFALFLAFMGVMTEKRNQESRATYAAHSLTETAEFHPTATPQSDFDISPYRWESSLADIDIILRPEFSETGGDLYVLFMVQNNSGQTCNSSFYDLYAEDNLGNFYEASYAWKTLNKDFSVPSGEKKMFMVYLTPWLDESAREITFYLDSYCGTEGMIIPVDLTASDITFSH
jgi:transcription initiation factor TFIIIB Brf1 subunit/transcription initiation factor TFIIB